MGAMVNEVEGEAKEPPAANEIDEKTAAKAIIAQMLLFTFYSSKSYSPYAY
jgi:hypothetical protein